MAFGDYLKKSGLILAFLALGIFPASSAFAGMSLCFPTLPKLFSFFHPKPNRERQAENEIGLARAEIFPSLRYFKRAEKQALSAVRYQYSLIPLSEALERLGFNLTRPKSSRNDPLKISMGTVGEDTFGIQLRIIPSEPLKNGEVYILNGKVHIDLTYEDEVDENPFDQNKVTKSLQERNIKMLSHFVGFYLSALQATTNPWSRWLVANPHGDLGRFFNAAELLNRIQMTYFYEAGSPLQTSKITANIWQDLEKVITSPDRTEKDFQTAVDRFLRDDLKYPPDDFNEIRDIVSKMLKTLGKPGVPGSFKEGSELKDFLSNSVGPKWVKIDSFNVYLAKGQRWINGQGTSTLEIQNFHNEKMGSGKLELLLQLLEKRAKELKIKALYIENVGSKRHHQFYLENGFHSDPNVHFVFGFGPNLSFFKVLSD